MMNGMKKQFIRSLLFLILPLLMPVAFLLITLNRYGVSVPYMDEWSMVPIFQKINQGKSPLGLFWAQWTDNRIFFPRLIMTVTAYVTHWHIAIESLLSVCFALLTAVLIYLIIQRGIKHRLLAFLTMLVSSFWLFSPVQSENWLWGWQLEWFICTAGAVATIYFINRIQGKKLYLNLTFAIVAAIVSSFSLSGGLVLWLIGLIVLIAKRQTKKPIIIWSVAAIVSLLAYFYKYKFISNGGGVFPLDFPHKIIGTISLFLALLGRPFTDNLDTAMLLGAISLLIAVPVLFMAWEAKKKIEVFLPWLSLMAFSLFGAAMIAVGRISDTLVIALHPRYTTFTILYIIGLSGLIFTLVDIVKPNPSKKLLKYVTIVALAINIPLLLSSYHFPGQLVFT